MYMGWRHPRIDTHDYYEFVDLFIQAVKRRWPKVLLQFEDFALDHATPLLQRYRDELCCFNDDIQGTAAVVVGTLLSACTAKKETLSNQRIVFAGAGSAGCGIADQIVKQMVCEGLTEKQARSQIFLFSKDGLLQQSTPGLLDFQRAFCTSDDLIQSWGVEASGLSLLDLVNLTKPTVLIGVSGQPGLFTKAIVESVNAHTKRPIVLALSNPNSQVEAQPADLLRWTNGDALVATGSPFDAVDMGDKWVEIAQCNNSYIFPGLGLGVIASGASRITENMMMAASSALAEAAPTRSDPDAALLPPLSEIREVSRKIAVAVYRQAVADAVALPIPEEILPKAIEKHFWIPEYREYRRTSF